MGVQMWQDVSLLVGDQELATSAKVFTLTNDVAALDVTPLSTTGWVELIGGLKSAAVDLELMTDLTDGGPDDSLWSNLGSPSVPHSIVTNSADGSTAYTFQGVPLSHSLLEGSVGDVSRSRLRSMPSSSPVVRGKLLHPGSASRSSSSTGTGRQLGAVAAGQSVFAALHVISADGTTPTLDVVVQSDDNSGFTTPTSRITFAQADDVTAEFKSTAGAITDDYWRVSYTIGGTDPSFSFAVVVGII